MPIKNHRGLDTASPQTNTIIRGRDQCSQKMPKLRVFEGKMRLSGGFSEKRRRFNLTLSKAAEIGFLGMSKNSMKSMSYVFRKILLPCYVSYSICFFIRNRQSMFNFEREQLCSSHSRRVSRQRLRRCKASESALDTCEQTTFGRKRSCKNQLKNKSHFVEQSQWEKSG